MIHWLNVELWAPMWPNMLSPSLITLAGVVISHVKAARQRERHHQDMKQHVTASVAGGSQGEDHAES